MQQNRGLSMKILELLVKAGPLSYAEIAAQLQVHAKNVSDASGELAAKNWIVKQIEQEGSTRKVIISVTNAGRARVTNGKLPGSNLPADNARACAEKEAMQNPKASFSRDVERIKELEAKVEELTLLLYAAHDEEPQIEPMGYVIVPVNTFALFESEKAAKYSASLIEGEIYLAAVVGKTKRVWE